MRSSRMPMTMTPRSSSGVPSALVPVQWISTKTTSPSTAERRTSAEVRDGVQQGGPVRAHLANSLKRAGRKLRLLAPIVLVEAGEHPLEVVRVLRGGQAVHHRPGVAHWASIRRAAGDAALARRRAQRTRHVAERGLAAQWTKRSSDSRGGESAPCRAKMA